MRRSDLHSLFINEFHSGKRPLPPTAGQLRDIEVRLDAALPRSYLEFMMAHGGAFTPSVLALILDRRRCIDDLQEIHGMWDVVGRNRGYWASGMPRELVSFGNDCMGNPFCFRTREAGVERPDDLPVLFFDHDRFDLREVSPSFDDFLDSLLSLKRIAVG
ncbi:hypothetical protein RW64_20725 [Geobacter sulfurreducens]|nr:hypothetical protein RW64_20725 [Geobacter sulfurreducens]